MIDHSRREHSRFSPSQAERFFNCPGSVGLARELEAMAGVAIELPPSKYALEGTEAHEHLEKMLLGQSKPGDVPEDMRPHLEVYVDYVSQVVKENPGSRYETERRYELPGVPQAGGTVDTVVTSHNFIEVIDLKYGAGVAVEAEDNKQLLQYAAAVAMNIQADTDCEVRMTIVQPRKEHPQGPIRTARTTAGDLWLHALAVSTAIDRADEPGAAYCVGDWCRWCPVKAFCPEMERLAKSMLGLQFGSYSEVKTGDLGSAADATADRLGEILTLAEIITPWLSAVRQEAIDRLLDLQKVTGWKLIEERKQRRWDSSLSQEVIADSLPGMNVFVNSDEVFPRTLLPLTKIEKLLKQRARKLEKTRAAKNRASAAVTDALAALIVKTAGRNPKLVTEDTKGNSFGKTVLPTFNKGKTDDS